MKKRVIVAVSLFALAFGTTAFAADNLRLNPKLDYTSDSQDGPLITGDNLQEGFVAGKPNYVIMYGEGCYNSKRQAQRTVSLWQKYKDRVNFVVVDLDKSRSRAQKELVEKYYKGYIPHVMVLDSAGATLYNRSGEVDEAAIASLFEKALK